MGLIGNYSTRFRNFIRSVLQFPDMCEEFWQIEVDGLSVPMERYFRQLAAGGILDLGCPKEAALHFINLANGGFRYLFNDPLLDPASQQEWAKSVVRLIWKKRPAG